MNKILTTLLSNHVLANLAFVLVLVMGTVTYLNLPREKDPEINFNWIQIMAILPGASAKDVERKVTNILEEVVDRVEDIRFISSSSRESISTILVRFEDIPERIYDKRLNDLRREVQSSQELPAEIENPLILEITTANAFPTATLVLNGNGEDEVLRRQAYLVKKDLEQLKDVLKADTIGLYKPQLQIELLLEELQKYGLNPTQIADSVRILFKDVAAGNLNIDEQQWLLRLVGSETQADELGKFVVLTSAGQLQLDQVAKVQRSWEKPETMAKFQQKPGVIFSVMKKASTNTITLVEKLNQFMQQRNILLQPLGLKLELLDDQTSSTRQAIKIMQTNALIGLIMVLVITWLFLGWRMSLLTCIGIPFIIGATFWFIKSLGFTLNNNVLLGIVISLGMLVDDAVVVIESMYYRIVRGMDTLNAAIGSLKEVFWPVTTAVLTTMASFLPLMLLPGIVGKFMLVVPVVVVTALAISLIEAYWMLPAHVIAANVKFTNQSKSQKLRLAFTKKLQHLYSKSLLKMLRYPYLAVILIVVLVAGVGYAFQAKWVKVNFFAMDSLPLFYVTVEMSPDASMKETLDITTKVEQQILTHMQPNELRNIASYAGQVFTETEVLFGEHWGQVMVSLNPDKNQRRRSEDIIAAMRSDIEAVSGAVNISILLLKDGPPAGRPISLKVRGNDFTTLRAATNDLEALLATMPGVSDINDTDVQGRMQLSLRINQQRIQELKISPQEILRTIAIMGYGELITEIRDDSEKVELIVRAAKRDYQQVDEFLDNLFFLPNGQAVPLRELFHTEIKRARSEIRHYNLRRVIQVEAELDKSKMNTVEANQIIQQQWQDRLQAVYPEVNLDFSGELDDIQESLDAMLALFLMGLGIMYMILGAQFRSYFQPLIILLTVVPLAFMGVIIGLIVSQNPLSMYTLYGVVALTGIAVNAAIVLMSAARDRLNLGMSINHATVYAARRRVIPILITSLTTIASLFSLATGLAGESLMWGPVATAIVWGLGFFSLFTPYIRFLIQFSSPPDSTAFRMPAFALKKKKKKKKK
ncbi:efflux RND transporter permease subunit, partial [Thiotrichales bacterium HSG1]|nr:efflux RND transporter permease subunit [Thiotrichales bacterium HSG1]